MKKFVIDHFDLRSKELKWLTVLEYIFMFCIVGLSLVLVNQSGEKLTEGSVSVSDAVSITCEALMYLCVVSLLALLHRGLGRVGRVNRVSMCRDALALPLLRVWFMWFWASCCCSVTTPKRFPICSIGRFS